eukprot:1304092-Alexandrium_andersonii.AAC.1
MLIPNRMPRAAYRPCGVRTAQCQQKPGELRRAPESSGELRRSSGERRSSGVELWRTPETGEL